jgi:hypothetical protein
MKCKEMPKLVPRKHWKMSLKALGDHLSNSQIVLQLFGKCPLSIEDLFNNTYRVEETLWEMPKNNSG